MNEFSNINLVPRVVSTIKSREDVDTSVKLGTFNLKIPIIASPMKDVCNGEFGNKLIELGCFGIVHRFCSIQEQLEEWVKNSSLGMAIGVNGDYLERFRAFNGGCQIFCIDVANGANIAVKEAIKELLKINTNVGFIVGNVASKETYQWLAEIPNVIGVRVGVAGGKMCTTKNATGIYHPMASLIAECKSVKKDGMPLIIADGGIREPSDFCKSIALGADCVMLGSVLASAKESPAELMMKDNGYCKICHGSASFEIQKTYREKPRYIEGKTVFLECKETIEEIIIRFSDGLKSSMSYFNARTIKEYQENVTYI